MTAATMNAETLTAAINKSNAKTISELWRHLGHQSAISGSQSKKIRGLLPNADAMFAANKSGKPIQAAPKPIQVVAAAKTPTTNVSKGTKIGGYRANCAYAAIFAEGNKGFTDRKEFITRMAQRIGKTEEQIRYDFYVVAPKTENAKSPSNRGTMQIREKDGTIRIIQKETVNA